jgi:DNA polymerase III epsilon subunit-like protein
VRPTGPVVVIYLDLETTGVDVSRDRVVEIAATQGFDSAHMPGASYAEVAYVPEGILRTPGAQAAARVHCIPDSEIAQGAAFPISWARFLAFTEAVLNNAIHEASDSSDDDEPPLPRPLDDPPSLLVAAHNGHRFDFAVLLFECHRHQLPMTPFRRWFFVDTLHVLESAKAELGGACLKLQCLASAVIDAGELRAHRALDDCIALRQVVHSVASRLDCSVTDLLRPFSVQWDEQASTAQVAALIEE